MIAVYPLPDYEWLSVRVSDVGESCKLSSQTFYTNWKIIQNQIRFVTIKTRENQPLRRNASNKHRR